MAFTFTQDAGTKEDASAGTIAIALTGVTAGSLIVLGVGHEGTPTTIAVSDGTSSLTGLTKIDNGNGDLSAQMFYLLSANSGDKTYTATFGANRPYRRIIIEELAHADTVVFDAAPSGGGASGSSTLPASGDLTTSGTAEAVVGFVVDYAAALITLETVLGSTASNVEDGHYGALYWRAATGTGDIDCLLGGSTAWIALAASFKEASAGATGLGRLLSNERNKIVRTW